jgi:hypothetical protein
MLCSIQYMHYVVLQFGLASFDRFTFFIVQVLFFLAVHIMIHILLLYY